MFCWVGFHRMEETTRQHSLISQRSQGPWDLWQDEDGWIMMIPPAPTPKGCVLIIDPANVARRILLSVWASWGSWSREILDYPGKPSDVVPSQGSCRTEAGESKTQEKEEQTGVTQLWAKGYQTSFSRSCKRQGTGSPWGLLDGPADIWLVFLDFPPPEL